jgi:hypothetical protein
LSGFVPLMPLPQLSVGASTTISSSSAHDYSEKPPLEIVRGILRALRHVGNEYAVR